VALFATGHHGKALEPWPAKEKVPSVIPSEARNLSSV
jgi:hypothetical protein